MANIAVFEPSEGHIPSTLWRAGTVAIGWMPNIDLSGVGTREQLY